MLERLRAWRSQFWFLPALMVVAAVALAQAVLQIDVVAGQRILAVVPGSFRLGAEGSRGLLSSVGGSTLAVAGTAFSITISVIATASSSYGPRLVRNFMADWRNQLVLGTFVATFVYTLLIQRAVTSGDQDTGLEGFVPYLGVYLTIGLALVNVAALVYFLHHISESIEVPNLVGGVRTEFERLAHVRYGSGIPDNAVAGPDIRGLMVRATEAGYVTSVEETALIRLARQHGTVIQVLAGPGAHVIEGEPLARIGADGDLDDGADVARAFTIATSRTAYQDIHFAAQQVIEIAVRALSPGTNDPYTARNAVAEAASGLVAVAGNPIPPRGRTDEDGELRLVLDVPSGFEVIDWVLTDLRTHATAEPGVIWEIITLAGRLTKVAPDDLAKRIRQHVDLLIEAYAEQGTRFDADRLRERRRSELD